MKLDILTPTGSTHLEVAAVFCPGQGGMFEVLPGHAAMLSTLTEGVLRWRTDEGEDSMELRGGVVKIKDNVIEVCAC